jgi:hypothetical protein
MRKASFQMDFDLRWKTIFICSVTVHTRVPSNGILPMLRIPNRQNLLNCIVRNFQFRKFLPVNSYYVPELICMKKMFT